MTFLENGDAVMVLDDGARIEIATGAGGTRLAVHAAEAGVPVHASGAMELVSPRSGPSPDGSTPWPGLGVLAFSVVGGAVLVRRWFKQRRQHVAVGGSRDRRQRGGASDVPTTRFSDVAGCAEAIEDLREMVDVLKHPEQFTAVGARTPKGAILSGPPGTGKTLLARAVAGEAGVPFFAAAGSDFVEMYVGVGAKRVRELFAKAEKAGGGIVFIDEIDAVGRRRSARETSAGEQESENTLIALLNELDGFRGSNTVVLAATNRPDVLDPALTRPGRLDRRVHVGLPDAQERCAILGVHLRNKPLAAGVQITRLAARTPGMSGAQLEQVCNEAALLAAREGLERLEERHLHAAVEYIAMGRARRSATVTAADRLITAWHEAGHAVCALRTAKAQRPVAVSIVPRGQAGGVTWMSETEEQFHSRENYKARLVVALGGRSAEEILLAGDHTAGASGDLIMGTSLAREMVDRFGMTDRGLSVRTEVSESSEEAVEALLQEAAEQARVCLASNRDLLDAMVTALLENLDLDARAIDLLDQQHPGTPGV